MNYESSSLSKKKINRKNEGKTGTQITNNFRKNQHQIG